MSDGMKLDLAWILLVVIVITALSVTPAWMGWLIVGSAMGVGFLTGILAIPYSM